MDKFLHDSALHIEGYCQSLVNVTSKLLLAVVVVLISWFIASRVRGLAYSRLKNRMHDPLLANFVMP